VRAARLGGFVWRAILRIERLSAPFATALNMRRARKHLADPIEEAHCPES